MGLYKNDHHCSCYSPGYQQCSTDQRKNPFSIHGEDYYDRIFGFRLAYGINLDLFGHEISKKVKDPERFDIVIFKYPDDESQLFIKRVIGLPGETVEIKDGKVYIDGSETALDDSFIPEKMQGSFGPYTVPDNCYFMLGDNRNDSKDSRFWKNTFVRFDQIVGKAVVRYYPSIKLLGYEEP